VEEPPHEFDDTSAKAVTMPEAPIWHCATPLWLMVARRFPEESLHLCTRAAVDQVL